MSNFTIGFMCGIIFLRIYEIAIGIIKYRRMPIEEREKLNKLLDRYK